MLSESQNWIREHNESARVIVHGQDYNPRSYAVTASDLLIKGHKDSRIEFGNTLVDDTGIGTFVWGVTNRKEKKRKGKSQLLLSVLIRDLRI